MEELALALLQRLVRPLLPRRGASGRPRYDETSATEILRLLLMMPEHVLTGATTKDADSEASQQWWIENRVGSSVFIAFAPNGNTDTTAGNIAAVSASTGIRLFLLS